MSRTNQDQSPSGGYSDEFKVAAVRRVTEEGYSLAAAAKAVGVSQPSLAGVESWNPHQLRHANAAEVRKQFGIEAAQVMLGHKDVKVTQVYAERNLELARKVAREMG